MDIRKIKKLIELVKKEQIGEIEIKEGEESVRISQFGQKIEENDVAKVSISERSSTPQSETIYKNISSDPSAKIPETSIDGKHIIRSPMIGTFYTSATPGSDPFVTLGQHIKSGDVLCIVEAMKMFNQIESDCSGTVVSCLVTNGQPVEYGQPLFIVEI